MRADSLVSPWPHRVALDQQQAGIESRHRLRLPSMRDYLASHPPWREAIARDADFKCRPVWDDPRSRRSRKRSNLVIGLTPVCICTNWLSTYTIFSVPVEGNPTIHRGCARNSGNYPTIHRGRTQTSAASAGVYRRFARFTIGVTLSRGCTMPSISAASRASASAFSSL